MQPAEGRNKMKSANSKSKQFNTLNQNRIRNEAGVRKRPGRTTG